MNMNDKKYLIIGGGGLLGSTLISALIESNANVIAVDRDLPHMENTLSSLGITHSPDKMELRSIDVTDESQISSLFKDLGHLDGVVNCSYPKNKNYGASFFQVSLENFNENVSLHLGSAFLIMRESAAYFERRKHPFSLVNIGSIYGSCAPDFRIYNDTDMTTPVEYAAIKSAIIHLNKYVATYVSNSNFRVNSVSPGGLLANQPKSFLDLYKSKTLGQGMLMPEDVIGSILFLLSDASSYINGQDLLVDDGFSL
jgi:NAD(P)-dependent dehydrogenase (short-subunit alcohol dehydrogenase family)